MLGVSPVRSEVNVAVPVCDPSVDVAMTVARVADVPYANPDCVASAPPVDEMAAFSVRVDVETELAASVVSVCIHGLVVKVVSDPYEVPCELVAYAV